MNKKELVTLTQRLEAEYHRLNTERFGGLLPAHRLRFSHTSARTHGRINFTTGKIMISLPMYEQYGWPAVENTLLHEMTHALLHMMGRHDRHTKLFWSEFKRRGGVRDRVDVKPRNAIVYACPTCDTEIHRMRRLKRPWMYSCRRCDKRYNPKHRLFLKQDRSQTA